MPNAQSPITNYQLPITYYLLPIPNLKIMNNFEQIQNTYKNYRDDYSLEQRKNWYSKVADAYNKTRPRYPQKLINRTVEIANLSKNTQILEIGCGPGTATTEFAKLL